MIFLGEFVIVNKANVMPKLTHSCPLDSKDGMNKTINELEEIGVLVDELPQSHEKNGFIPELHLNPETKEVWYEYTEMPKSDEELTKETIGSLQQDNAQLLKENVKKRCSDRVFE